MLKKCGDAELKSKDHPSWTGSLEHDDIDAFLLNAVKRVRRPRLLMDMHCKVLWSSPHAELILQPPLPLTIASGELCTAAAGERGRAWAAFIENLGPDEETHFIAGPDSSSWVVVRAWALRVQGHRTVFVDCIPSMPFRAVEESGLPEEFGLTRSECSVLNLFVRLMKPDEIAEHLGISLSTVRSHLKQIHTKMGVNSGTHLLQITRAFCDR